MASNVEWRDLGATGSAVPAARGPRRTSDVQCRCLWFLPRCLLAERASPDPYLYDARDSGSLGVLSLPRGQGELECAGDGRGVCRVSGTNVRASGLAGL